MTKNNEVIAENPFHNSGVTRRLWRFQHTTVLERSTEVGFSLILSIYKVVYISIKDLHAGYAPKCFAVKFAKKIYITPLKTTKMPPITLVNAWPS